MLNELYIEGFFGIGNATIPLQEQGLVLIEGVNDTAYGYTSNGAGKSSIFEAICWCLFAQTIRKLDYIDDVVNEHTETGCLVRIKFKYEGSWGYFQRTRKHHEFGNSFTVQFENESLAQEWSKFDAQDVVHTLLGLDFIGFQYVLMFGQNATSFLSEAKDSEQKRLYESILIPDNYTQIFDKVIADRDKVYAQTATLNLAVHESTLNQARLNLETLQISHDQWNETQKTELLTLSNEYFLLSQQSQEKNCEVEAMNGALVDVRSHITSAKDALVKVKEGISWLTSIINKLNADIVLRKTQLTASLNLDKAALRSEIQTHIQNWKDSCQESIKRSRSRIDDHKVDKGGWAHIQTAQNTIISGITPQIQTLKNRAIEIQAEIDSPETTGARCNYCFSLITEETVESHTVHLKEQLGSIQLQIGGLEQEIQAATVLREDAVKQLTRLDQLIGAEEATIKSIESQSIDEPNNGYSDHLKVLHSKMDVLNSVAEASDGVIQSWQAELVIREESLASFSLKQAECVAYEAAQVKEELAITKDYDATMAVAKSLETQTAQKYAQLEAKKLLTNPYDLEAKSAEIVELTAVLQQKRDEEQRLNQEAMELEFLEEMFSDKGLKSYLFDYIVVPLNQEANRYAQLLTNNEMVIQFNTTKALKNGSIKENFNIQVTNTKGGSTYRRNSGGERKRANICIFKAAREILRQRTKNQLGISFYDEFDAALDPAGQSLVFELMELEVKERGTVFLISHSPQWKARFEETGQKIITVTKNPSLVSTVSQNW